MLKITTTIGLISLLPLELMSATKIYIEHTNKHQINLPRTISTKNINGNTRAFNNTLGFSNDISLEQKKVYNLKNGKVVRRYTQKFKNIPVIGGDVIIHSNRNSLRNSIYGSAIYNINDDINTVNVKFSSKEALKRAKEHFIASLRAKNVTADENLYDKESSLLKVWQNTNNTATLIYEVQFTYMGKELTMPHYYIDANTGEFLKSFDNLKHANATGPGGNEKTGQYNYGVGSEYGPLDVTQNDTKCIMENEHVRTIDLNNKNDTRKTTPFQFECPNNTYKAINGAFSPLNDAHYFGGVVYNLYQNLVGVPPLRTKKLLMKVHVGVNLENAHWDGTSMLFGDGGNTLYPLTVIDVTSHEISHGFTEENSNLAYYGKSGGLNESFSDIAGEAAEFYLKGDADWIVGADATKNSIGLRSLSNPTSIPPSIDHQDDFFNNMNVHYSSGVFNKAYYLLSTTTGWDPRKAFKVYAKANQLYWTSNTDWDNAGEGVVHAARDLGYSTENVCTSLSAVGVHASSCTTPSPDNIPNILFNTDVSSNWTADETSVHRGDRYAKYYQFTLTESKEVTIDLTSSEDTYLFLLTGDSKTSPINAENDDIERRNHNSRITKTLPAGTYVIEATTYNARKTGDFTVRVTTNNGSNNSNTIPTIVFNTDVSSNWTADETSVHRGDRYAKYYQFTLTESKEVTIDLTSSEDTYLFLLTGDSKTSPINAENDDDIERKNHNSRITKTLPAGTYVIEATTYKARKTGDFTVRVTTNNGSNNSNTIPTIVFNTDVSSNWTADETSVHRGDTYAKYYQFTLTESKEVTIDLTSSEDTYLFLLTGDSKTSPINAENDDITAGNRNSNITKTLPAGTYVIEATTYPAGRIGNFTIRVTASVP